VRFSDLLSRIAASDKPLTIAVVGGGAGGVELALALAYRLKQERAKPGGVRLEQSDLVK
jgi:selenide,water dikinase